MEPRGRGRARGRARSSGQGAPQPGPPGHGPGYPQGPGSAPQGAWAARAPQVQQAPRPQPPQPTPIWVRPQASSGAEAAQGGAGRGLRHGGGDEAGGPGKPPARMVVEGDRGDQLECSGRRGGNGGVRGRTNRNEIITTRPSSIVSKIGKSGTPLKLQANYFELLQAGKWCLNQYRVDFSPDIDNTSQRRHLMRQAFQSVLAGYLFDGTVMYTPQTLNPDPVEKFVETDNAEKIRITVRRVGDVAWGDYHYIQLFNLIIRKCLHYLQFQMIGRNYFDPVAKITIQEHKLELWPGYYTSIRQHENKILMTADTQFKVMRTDNMYDMLLQCNSNPREFQSRVINNVVLTYYNNKTYRIDDVDFNASPQTTFPMKDGTQITYIDYYKQKYNIKIHVEKQPMLVSRSKAREIRAGMPETVYLVPELCQLTGLSDKQRENFQLMSKLAEHTRVSPDSRINKLREFCNRLRSNEQAVQELKRWDLKIANTIIDLPGRQLAPEQIVLGGNVQCSAGNFADWNRDLRSNSMYVQQEMKMMVVVYPAKLKRQTDDFLQSLQRAAGGMRFRLNNIRHYQIDHDGINNYLSALETILSGSERPSLIMCILPNNTLDRYVAIKKKCTVDRGIPTQVILNRSLNSKGVMSIATKVAIQLNCKIGGAPWSVIVPIANMMVVGYDVCRDTSKQSKSYGAMVASLDRQCTRYINFVTEHQHEEELSNNFATMLVMCCKEYYRVNKTYPDKILIYRDGVGDGQLGYVYDHELKYIDEKLAEIYQGKPFQLCVIIVSKRINTRVFHNMKNPPPGTVVDDVITLPERYDFFIVSQCVRQGTVAPTSYNVIKDTLCLPPDRIQILTYKLCHMYFNWSGTVRVPAPCQYAHKLAFFTAKILHRQPHRDLANTLFYL